MREEKILTGPGFTVGTVPGEDLPAGPLLHLDGREGSLSKGARLAREPPPGSCQVPQRWWKYFAGVPSIWGLGHQKQSLLQEGLSQAHAYASLFHSPLPPSFLTVPSVLPRERGDSNQVQDAGLSSMQGAFLWAQLLCLS